MKRRNFMGLLASGVVMGSVGINSLLDRQYKGPKMPALFIGHGSPMNAIEDNAFTRALSSLGKSLPLPEAILCISAHWMTEGTFVTQMERPPTIHDFYGFPQPLFDVQYAASGKPEVADLIQKSVLPTKIMMDHDSWGLDHGTWSVLRHMYPQADVPVLQLSLDLTKGPEYHFKLGQELARLREKGILILGSGNIVHNLRKISWEKNALPLDWALEFDHWAKDKIEKRDFKALQQDFFKTEAGKLSVPTLEHYLPLLYTLGLGQSDDELKFEYEEIQNGSISMRCLSLS